MPWSASDAARHNKHATGSNASKWAKIANAALASGKSEASAIRISNAAIRRRRRKGK